VVEARHDHGIAMIIFGWGIKVEGAFHTELTGVIFAFAAGRCQWKNRPVRQRGLGTGLGRGRVWIIPGP
jgi:uncharacterized spore protein YtfJ